MSVVDIVIGAGEGPGVLRASLPSNGDGERSIERVLENGSREDPSTAVGEMVDALVQSTTQIPETAVVRLLPPLGQVRTLRDLPPLKEHDLERLLAEHSDRFFRPAAGPTVVGARWYQDGEVQGRAALVESALLERIEEVLDARSVHVPRFLVAAHAEDDPVEVLSTRQRARLKRRRTRLVAAAASVMVLSWVVPAGAYWYDLLRDDALVRSELARAQSSLASLESLERRLAEFGPVAAAFAKQTRRDAWAARELADIAAKLPRDVHLHSIRVIEGGEAQLEVHAPDASSVPGSLEGAWAGRLRVSGEPSPSEPFTVIVEPAS